MRHFVVAAALLAAAAARARFGAPDEEVGSGLRIYVYRLEDRKQLWLG